MMASSFGRGSGKPAPESAERGHALNEGERKLVYAGATVLLVLLAILALVLGGKATGLNACKGILLQAQRTSCFQALAYGQANASICGYIPSGAQHDGCIASIAEAGRNASLCTELDNSTALYQQCVLNVSSGTGNIGYCQLLGTTAARSACAFNITKAQGFGSMAACDAIADAALRAECTYLTYYNGARLSSNASLCGLIPGSANNTLLSLMLTENASYGAAAQQSSYLNLNATPQSYCYYRLAVQTANESLCSRTSGLLGYVCKSALTPHNATPQNITNVSLACASVPGSLQVLCTTGLLTSQAITGKNVTKCLQIQISQYIDSCITTYASEYSDASACSYIANASAEQRCSAGAVAGAGNATP